MNMVIDASAAFIGNMARKSEEENRNKLTKLQIWCLDILTEALENNLIPRTGEASYLFIKLPDDQGLHDGFSTFYKLQLLGYIPIIRDAEKNTYLKRHRQLFQAFIQRGALIHVNAASLVGGNGKAIQKYALKLCKRNDVHLLAADFEHFQENPFLLKTAYSYLEKKVSTKYVDWLKGNITNIDQGLEFHVD